MHDLQSNFDFLEKCISIEKESVWRLSKSDPIAALLLDLEDAESAIPTCGDLCHSAYQDVTARASTSHAENSSGIFFDSRIRYGRIITSVLEEIARKLLAVKGNDVTTSALVSLKHIALTSSAFQFFILTCISPYLDKGVGVPLHLRSYVIKSWEQCACDVEFKKLQLSRAAQCVIKLLTCNDAIQSELLRKYSSDIICLFEQLKHFEMDISCKYYELLEALPPHFLVSTLLGLIRPRTAEDLVPSWFTLSIGSQLSTLLVGKNGLEITLASYQEINGEQFWQNAPLLSVVAKQFALPPKNMKKMAYYQNITSQFFYNFNGAKIGQDKLIKLFSLFAIEVKEINSFAYGVFVEDVIFKPWEILVDTVRPQWTTSNAMSLLLMKHLCCDKIGSGMLKENHRFIQITPILLSLLPMSIEDHTCGVRNLKDDLEFVLRFALQKITNLSDFLLIYMTEASPSFRLRQEWKRVQEIDETASIYGKVTLSRSHLDKDELLVEKVDAVIAFLKDMDSPIASRLCIEIACKCVTMWDDGFEGEQSPRFISPVGPSTSCTEFRRSSAHFIASAFFEQLSDDRLNLSDANIVLSLLNLIQVILRSTMRYLRASHKNLPLDVVTPESSEDQQLYSTISQNAKMAVGLTGAVVMAATLDEKVYEAFSETCTVLESFSEYVNSLGCNHYLAAVATDAQKLVSLFGKQSSVVRQTSSVCTDDSVKAPDVVTTLRDGLADASPVTRGAALLDAGRLIRARDVDVLLQLDQWLFEALKEALDDSDSYVYLAAINALAEAACYASAYLRELVSLFKNLHVSTKAMESENVGGAANDADTLDNVIVVRSRICEVLGKVFRVLGDMSPVWMNECAGTFLMCLCEEEEIIRASALTSLAELIFACHGRNIEKYLDEIFFALEKLITRDKSALVRRASVNLLRQIIKSCETAVFEIVGGRLRDIHRDLLRLWRLDSDHVVRLHAELALEELRAIMKTALQQW